MTFILVLLGKATKPTLSMDNSISFVNSIFFWIAIVELLVILFLIFKLKSRKSNLAFSELKSANIKNAKTTEINMDNLMDSINGSRGLYKELSRRCHPDNFINDPKQKNAQEIFQEITKYERNFEKLNLLKSRAINELNVTF